MSVLSLKNLVAILLVLGLVSSPLNPPTAHAQNTSSNSASTSSTAVDTSSFDEQQSKAFYLVMDGKFDDAEKIVSDALKREKNQDKKTELYYFLAAIQRMSEKYELAIGNLKTVFQAQCQGNSEQEHLNRALIFKRLGDCYWGMRKTEPALNNYKASMLECSNLPPNSSLLASVLESLIGTYVHAKNLSEAETYGKQLLQVTSERAKSQKLEDVASLFWTKIQLLGVYRSMGKEDERMKLWQSSTELLNKLLSLRAQLEASENMSEIESQMKAEFEERYISQFHPATPAEYLWLASEFKLRTMPLIQWAAVEKAKSAILCIHGLGLDNRSYTPFGREMAKRNYSVYALDVRGFGSWQTTQGQEDVQFKETLKDIGAMIKLIKQREPGLPVILLGESMGGAIALRGAAAFGSELAGVISSVPSAELFQQRRMSFTVAMHLIEGGSNKPFRVGDMVTDKATQNEALQDKWRKDTKAKLDMSPKELIKFALFMRTTQKECQKITNTPVFVVQGLKDKLVNPEGTYNLFEAVKCPDKDLLILGNSEHLIFETFYPQKMLLDALTTWIDDHSQAPKTESK